MIKEINGFHVGDVVRIVNEGDCTDWSQPATSSVGKIVTMFSNSEAFLMIEVLFRNGISVAYFADALLPLIKHTDPLTALVLFGAENV